MARPRTPVVEGWFTGEGDAFRLLGTRCADCEALHFPRVERYCRNPACSGEELREAPLSRRGRIWSYTENSYRPPAPYVSDPEAPWEPRVLLAVTLDAEGITVLGQAVPGTRIEELRVGAEVELTQGVLGDAGEVEVTTWEWRLTGAGA